MKSLDRRWWPDAFDGLVPSRLVDDRFVAVPLTIEVAALDYAAYMASPDVIRDHSDGRWPVEGFTLAEDLELVALHQRDHESRRAFTFTLLDPSWTESLGCLYVNPMHEYLDRVGANSRTIDALPGATASVTFWLRQDQHENGLPDAVAVAVNRWLLDDWPLDTHLFRVLPSERTSRVALERLGLPRVEMSLADEPRPYLWFGPGGR